MSKQDSILQSEAFSLEEIYQSDITDEQNKLIIEFMRNMQEERDLLPRIVCADNKTEENKKKNICKDDNSSTSRTHQMFNIIDRYSKGEQITYFSRGWTPESKQNIIQYVRNLRSYIHKKYNRKIIDTSKCFTSNCAILSQLQKNEKLLSTFSTKPLCVHLYIYGINYKQIIYYIDVITEHLKEQMEENLFLFIWLVYLLILLDSLQAVDMDVSSNLQNIKRFCIKKIENIDENIVRERIENYINFLTHFNCKSGTVDCSFSPHCPIDVFYLIYFTITDIFNQK
ncbi:conserved Plasmodium protein, unknown function [Plasmodium ovale wallikeri]|uniref:Uncharacterized protein n=2 Tax=Plasmodium ovale TaxID=36330 RepID=A0A1A8YV65_PLAOA|nr:conserved Plasmodium protein, unknown function [Plasmodium ovale wallikeri]SBT35942.1 conserved Plasmodium protein, unknown function [Plasmodium ovale wallikeri]SBT77176.1 conserved Plasmodium protein, unknown function [Plasmodium ovale]